MIRTIFVLLWAIFFITNTEITIENFNESLPIEKGQLEESIVNDTPRQLKGSIEDELLKVSILAQIESDSQDYMTNIEFYNKSGKSLNLVFDCGLLISNDQFVSKSGECPAVESMLLKKDKRESVSVVLSRKFFATANDVITIRYRQDTATKDLEIKLEAP